MWHLRANENSLIMGKNVRHLQWKLSLAGTSISLKVFPVFPQAGSKALCVKVRQRTGPANTPGHRERISEAAIRILCGRNEKNRALPGCSRANGAVQCFGEALSVQEEQECAHHWHCVPAVAPQPLSSVMLIPNSLIKLIIHLLSFVTLTFPKGHCFWSCEFICEKFG